ncbi:hypothetical protein BC936DRAFT_145789 [Jimgerdemannia flammicorona]|uniref:Uncharacterized protein n=1 Tax=Jimgerdemannia flammicorona TaxID=994334 RepID=A0A433D986_9FUNG|nr:hypothetical protein BC936DRAFT_145789 [Jimgerdemannia flammicorona]
MTRFCVSVLLQTNSKSFSSPPVHDRPHTAVHHACPASPNHLYPQSHPCYSSPLRPPPPPQPYRSSSAFLLHSHTPPPPQFPPPLPQFPPPLPQFPPPPTQHTSARGMDSCKWDTCCFSA